MPRLQYLLPMAAFVPLIAGLAFSLGLDHRSLPSTLIDRPTPAFSLGALDGAREGLSSADLRGRVTLLNVFASWCAGCRAEHPVLMRLAAANELPIYGLNWKDRRTDGIRWLAANKSPYARVGLDESGRTGIDLGVTGVPETFVIDRSGRIRYRYPGPLTEEVWRELFEPLLKSLRGEP
ncbi:DsbE family thiol:disulfide interchange protein [Bradyrhizobium sp.]|uniref:DsbE family thiol:disulfide interchange protein n=1 Tax=Bradyrhizobium sp. TaxID=376 RepID=UPI001DF37FEF|nr:DsbE family thiol:disulfide interchange protein [Bradyrhizobium sp.]MBI5319477.1 DsbE family thiol:disulfide interchange protein [Bradyrhizobium sp.]